MAWKLAYYDEALVDIREAKDWYFKQQQGLEKRFAEDVKQCINRLQKDPLQYEIKYKEVRTAHCTTFPYSVHFYMDKHVRQLVIIAVVHQRRNPEFSQERE